MLFVYFGPEVALPVASVPAAVERFLLRVGRVPFRLAAKGCASCPGGSRGGETSGPDDRREIPARSAAGPSRG